MSVVRVLIIVARVINVITRTPWLECNDAPRQRGDQVSIPGLVWRGHQWSVCHSIGTCVLRNRGTEPLAPRAALATCSFSR
jgi:hypothetical protein